MKTLSLLLIALALDAGAQTNDWARELTTAKRIIGGRTMDITALVNWHMQASKTERPLKAWVQVTGQIVNTNANGWVIRGAIDGESQAKVFIIRNQPVALQSQYNQLLRAFAQLERLHKVAQDEFDLAKQRYDNTEAEFKRQNYIRFSGDGLDLALDGVNGARTAMDRSSQALQNFDWRGQRPNGEFVLMCFAMKTGLVFQGIPIYDHGTVVK